MKVIPAELFLLHQLFVVEESLSIIRHDVRNRLGAIRNANFYVRRRLQKLAPDVGAADPRVPEFLALIASEADATEPILASRLPAPEHGELVAASAVVDRARAIVSVPPNVRTTVDITADAQIRIAPDEAALAMYCLIENAVDALAGAEGTIVRATLRAGEVVIEVDDDAPGTVSERALEPFFTTRTGRMGIGLNMARRIAARWGGSFAFAARDRGARAELAFGSAT
jgi:signal transduction histidine kinase